MLNNQQWNGPPATRTYITELERIISDLRVEVAKLRKEVNNLGKRK